MFMVASALNPHRADKAKTNSSFFMILWISDLFDNQFGDIAFTVFVDVQQIVAGL